MKVLVVIPAFNEEEAIEKTVKEVLKENVDCVVINDCSKDNTSVVAKKAGAVVIDLVHNLGIGGAVQTGYLYALEHDYDIAIQIDGDGQHNPKYIKKLVKEIENGADMVIGSRFLENTGYRQTKLRMLGIRMIRGVISLLSGTKIMDPTSGFRAINRNVIEVFSKNYPYDYPEPITNLRLLRGKYMVREVSTVMRNRETGTSFVTPLKSVYYMYKVLLALFIEKIRKAEGKK